MVFIVPFKRLKGVAQTTGKPLENRQNGWFLVENIAKMNDLMRIHGNHGRFGISGFYYHEITLQFFVP